MPVSPRSPPALLLAFVCACLLAGCSHLAAPPAMSVERELTTQPRELPDFSRLVDDNAPAIVNVSAYHELDAQEIEAFEAWRSLSKLLGELELPAPESQVTPARRSGSGFIVSPDGYIFTDAHVVQDASEVRVRLMDRREVAAELVGVDEPSDIAVLKIALDHLPVVRLGDSSRLKAGQWVAAIGAPFGLDNSITVGVVSGIARSLDDSDTPLIQTDVSINPGSSGGPLFNLAGEVIGVNSQIMSRNGGFMGLSFAVPIAVAQEVRQEIMAHGRVVRGRLGAVVQEMDASLAQHLGLDRARGTLVNAVEPGGPADTAGIEAGDVILDVAGTAIEHATQLNRVVAHLQPGSEIALALFRNGAHRQVTARIGTTVESPVRATQPASPPRAAGAPAGLHVRLLRADERRALGTRARLVVTEVTGAALRAGIEVGDLLIAIDRKPIDHPEELRAALAGAGRIAGFHLERDREPWYIPVVLDPPERSAP